MLSDSLPLQSSSSKSTTADNNNGSNVNVAALQIQSSSSNSSQKLSVSSKDNNSLNGHSTSNHSTTNSTNNSNYMDRPPRVRTSSNGSNVTSGPGSANNSPKQRSPKPPPLSCVTDSNGGIGGQQFPSSPLGKSIYI